MVLQALEGRSDREAGMRVVNMHEAKTHLSRLVKAAVEGEPSARHTCASV